MAGITVTTPALTRERDLMAVIVKALKVLMVGLVATVASLNLYWVFQSRAQPYRKDFQTEYLMARALANGDNPYRLMPDLARRWLPAAESQTAASFPHPSPYPIAVGWVSLPLAALTYQRAVDAWLAIEGLCLGVAVALWYRLRGRRVMLPWVILTSLGLFAFYPLALEVGTGQLSVCLLPLFMGGGLALRRGADATGGLCLGGLVVLKLMGGPILLWLAWQRRWRAVGWAAAVWVGVHATAIGLHGWPMVRDYYLRVGPLVSEHYRTHAANISWWTLGTRLFGEINVRLVSVPLWDEPRLARALGILIPVGALWLLLRAGRRTTRFDTAYALLMGGGLFVSPVAWVHYFVMLLPALYLLFQHLVARRWPLAHTGAAVLLVNGIVVPTSLYFELVRPFVRGVTAEGLPIMGAVAALVWAVPMAAASLLLWQLVWLDRTDATAPAPGETMISY